MLSALVLCVLWSCRRVLAACSWSAVGKLFAVLQCLGSMPAKSVVAWLWVPQFGRSHFLNPQYVNIEILRMHKRGNSCLPRVVRLWTRWDVSNKSGAESVKSWDLQPQSLNTGVDGFYGALKHSLLYGLRVQCIGFRVRVRPPKPYRPLTLNPIDPNLPTSENA